MRTRIALAFVLTAAVLGCDSSPGKGNGDGGGGGGGNGDGGGGGGGGDLGGTDPSSGVITLTVRDFKLYSMSDATTNPDFENVPKTDQQGNPSTTYLGPWDDKEVVTDTLGADNKPVYKNTAGKTLTTHGKSGFDQWYRDVPGTNIKVDFPITLTQAADGTYGYDSNVSGVLYGPGSPDRMFFPIDDGGGYATAFGNQGDPHNYSFTVESHTVFTYTGGETFRYRGDDDVFVYINKKLLINLGGIHDPENGMVMVDSLGLTKGQTYPLDFFFAERHKGGSNVLFTTTLKLSQAPIM